MADGTCSIDGCGKPRYQRRRLCSTHAMRKHRYGDPHVDKTRTGRTWNTENGYHKRTVPGHPLADDKDAVAIHRIVLFDTIGPGSHSCHWCGSTVEWRHFEGRWDGVLVVDHLDDNKHNNEASNLVPSCFSCNTLRARWGNDAVRRRRTVRA